MKDEKIDKLKFEKIQQNRGKKFIAGIDEVGRGCLAGPVCTACVILPLDDLIEGVDDSKKLSPKRREELAEKIKQKAVCYSVTMVDEKTIDKINILNATMLCMKRSIESMKIAPDVVLVDAISKLDVNAEIVGIIKGDSLSYLVGAASILAKVERDNFMTKLAAKYPEYGFEKNKGYGTKQHIEALKKFGRTDCHRISFTEFLEE